MKKNIREYNPHRPSIVEIKNLMFFLMYLGFESKYKGFGFLLDLLINSDTTMMADRGIDELTMATAKKYGTNIVAVERDVRTMLDAALSFPNDILREVFGFVEDNRNPTYNELISTLLIYRRYAMTFSYLALYPKKLEILYDQPHDDLSGKLGIDEGI